MGKRKRYTAEEKIQILREVLEEGKSVSHAAEQYGVPPNNIFRWKKRLFEDAVHTFQIQRTDISVKAEERKISVLEQRLKQKDEIIAELEEEHLALKKKNCGRR